MGVRKGCYNCCKRRIACDESEPQCMKCVKKGLDCSGSGIRYRFNHGIASRGKLRGLTVPIAGDSCLNAKSTPSTTKTGAHALARQSVEAVEVEPSPPLHQTSAEDNAKQAPPENPSSTMTASLDLGSSQLRQSLNYFSTAVASNMVILDDEHNGYRNIILPIAVYDDLVQQAVCSVSAYALWHDNPIMRASADNARSRVIQTLKNASMQSNNDRVFSVSTWVTLLVLLVGELILGGDHYAYLLRMMCVLRANGVPNGDPDIVKFLQRQTNMLTFLAQPFIDSQSGIPILTSDSGFEDYCNGALDCVCRPSHYQTIQAVIDATIACATIFRNRVQGIQDGKPKAVDRVKELVLQIHPTTAAGHSLVWAYFIAAADSDTTADRLFFSGRLSDIHKSTGCANITEGLEMLRHLWARPSDVSWTTILPSIATTFVM